MASSDPRLTIVTITYKDPEGLARTIESLRPLATGAFGLWEHVIVDSSPSDSGRALEGLATRGWPLRHLVTEPTGVYAAQNAGISAAHGGCIWFLNGGDSLLDGRALDDCLKAFDCPTPPDLLVAAVQLLRNSVATYVQRPREPLLLDLIGRNRVCHQGVLYRRKVFEQVGPFSTELALAADYDHLLRCLAAGCRFETRPDEVIAAYEVTGRSSVRYHEAFNEFRTSQRALARQLPLAFSVASELVRPLAHARVTLVKMIADLPFGPTIRTLWHSLKRSR